jgi:general secretion pathway protein A
MHIILSGQPDLRERLSSPDLDQLSQRITIRYHLTPLEQDDTHAYINHRLRQAAAGPPMTFGAELTGAIHERSGGLPRLINVICDAVLMAGYGEDREVITAPLVATVIRELEESGHLGSRTPGRRPWGRAGTPFQRQPAVQGS